MTTDAKWQDFVSLDATRTLAAANRLLPAWVGLIIIVIIAWQLARIIWMLIPGPSAGDMMPVPASITNQPGTATPAADVTAIAAAHLFGMASTEPAEVQPRVIVETENLRDTRLSSLALRGTLAADPAEQAVAIIADGSNDEKVYGIGDSVTSGAKLHAVYADRVVLDENGVLTNLKLPKDFPAGTATITRRDTRTTSRAAASNQSIQDVITQNASQLADIIRPTPYFVNGQQQGYRVYPGRNRAQFAALGLRPGDLIKDIDGQSLTDPSQAMQIFQSLSTADQVSVTVERNGQPEVIVLQTSQLDLEDETSQ
jgi:general secretion pathway protein C